MLNDKVIRTTFIISLTGHIFLLSIPEFNLPLLEDKKHEEIAVRIEIEKPPLLPEIDVLGEKKLKEIAKEKQLPQPASEPEPKPQPEEEKIVKKTEPQEQAEEEVIKEAKPESLEETVEVINPSQEEKIIEEAESSKEIQEVVRERLSEKPVKGNVEVIDPAKKAMLRYQDMIKQRIEAYRRYPNWAKKQGFEGIVSLTFTVLSTGQVQDIKIIQSSGFNILDKEAVATIKRASPFPPIPKEVKRPWVRIEVSIAFVLN